jgi:hypothetical protein
MISTPLSIVVDLGFVRVSSFEVFLPSFISSSSLVVVVVVVPALEGFTGFVTGVVGVGETVFLLITSLSIFLKVGVCATGSLLRGGVGGSSSKNALSKIQPFISLEEIPFCSHL